MTYWDLPEGWETARLEQLVQTRSGFACAKRNLVGPEQGVPHLRPFNVGTDGELDLSTIYYIPLEFKSNVEEYALEPGHVLFNNTNSVELVGKTAIVREPLQASFSNHITRLTVEDESRLAPQWLALALRQLWGMGYFEANCNRWIGQAGFNTSMLTEVEIPLPSLPVQRRIVARIEALFAELGEARRLQKTMERDSARLMGATLTDVLEDLSEQPRLTIKELKKQKKLVIIGGGTPSRKNLVFWKGDIPWVSPKEMKHWLIQDTEEHISARAVDASSAKLIPPGSVLVVVRGMILARTWPVAITEVELTINQDMKALCPKRGIIPEYLGYMLWAVEPEVLTMIETAAHGTKRLRTSVLESLTIPQLPLSEQCRIAAYLDSMRAQIEDLKGAQDKAAVEQKRLGEAILSQAFRG